MDKVRWSIDFFQWSTETSTSILLDLLTHAPRSTQFLATPMTHSGNDLVASLEGYMRLFLSDVRVTRHQFAKRQPGASGANAKVPSKAFQTESAAGRDPEIVFYSGVSPQSLIIYRCV